MFRGVRYGIGDVIVAFLLGLVLGACAVGLSIVDNATADVGDVAINQVNDAEGIAQCIAEFEYTHQGNRFNKLVRAIRWCNVGDRATARECVVPCRVTLPKGTLEDEFGIDYGWVKKGHPVVDVWVKGGR